ncbi:hypothetical protein LHJ74_07925 [Streptomyces sp. N2-109]|uniref:Uncharacterized protein n=1 Tax=Streptomyces gossypii TaxID=2883101 RepID=A0ABT2JPP1_9ACTN|nr:hypothetical protein [Streptomyces gossypii]MCT2589842.1 hypothetical protein [Streptomyces gossypii]
MPQTDIRPHVVALLCDADFKHQADPRTWNHRDGRPFTTAEQETALSATRAEFEEFHAQHKRYMEYLRKTKETPDALQSFLAPFMEQLTHKTLGNAAEIMTTAQRAELDHLLKSINEPTRPFTPYTF